MKKASVFRLSACFVRSRAAALVVVSLFAASLTASVHAALPLATMLESQAGRILFGEVAAGRAAATQLVGRESASSIEAIRGALADPRMSSAASDLWTRLNRIEIRFADRYPGAADVLFGDGGTAHALSAEQRAFLERIAGEELDANFVRTLPRVPSTPLRASDAAAQRILEQSATRMTTAPETAEARLARWAKELKNSKNGDHELAKVTRGTAVKAAQAYRSLRSAHPELDGVLKSEFVYEVLSDSGSKALAERAGKVFTAIAEDVSESPLSTKLVRAFENALAGEVPSSSIASRIDALRTSGSVQSIRRALGELTLDESRQMLYGSKPLQPSKQSLIGQYLEKTGASSVVRSFPVAPGSTEMGPQRLVVAVDASSLAEFKKIVDREIFFGQLHTPHQGTLMVEHAGKTGTYASLDGGAFRMPSQGTMLPLVVMSSTEGGRMTRYFDLGSVSRSGLLSGNGNYDYSLTDSAMKPWKFDTYCARSAYGSCTHWVANIPIGDKLVTEYQFPGWIDHDPYTAAADRGEQNPAPRVATLEPYELASASAMGSELVHDVWGVPGHQQLADVLGVTAQSLGAELTNPGWVAITMTARVPQNRLPVVFLFVGDAKAPIDPNFDPQINAH